MLYRACEDLLARYPAAAQDLTGNGSQTAMIVMLATDSGPKFFILHHVSNGTPRPFWSVLPWGVPSGVTVEPDGSAKRFPGENGDPGGLTMDEAEHAVVNAVPLPPDGTLFGWAPEGAVTALIPFDYGDGDGHSVPTWCLMPSAGTSKAGWPCFADKRLFGEWFWEYHRAGLIVELSVAVARTRRTAWWVNGEAYGLCTGLCAVAREVPLPGAQVLPAGLYAGCDAHNGGLPGLGDVLAGRGKTDLGPHLSRL